MMLRRGALMALLLAGVLLLPVGAGATPLDEAPLDEAPLEEVPSSGPTTSGPPVDRTPAGDGVGIDQTLPEPVEPQPPTTQVSTRRVEFQDINALLPGDPAYGLAAQIRTLRVQVSIAIERAETAESTRLLAQEELDAAEFRYTVAALRAEHAQRIVNRWAAGMYRSETGAGETVDIINSSLDDPTTLLDIRTWFAEIGDSRQRAVDDAQQALLAAEQRRAEADEQAAKAHEASNRANYERRRATRELEIAKRSLDRLVGQTVSEQILIGDDGCPVAVPENTLRKGAVDVDVADLCARSVAAAPTPEAALAIKYAFRALGADYACEGIGRWEPFRYDCSSLVMRAYKEGAGLNMTNVGGYIPSTRNLVPWNGVPLAPWADEVSPEEAKPGDLVLYDTGRVDTRHVVLLLVDGLMLHVGACNDVVHITDFWGYKETKDYTFLVARRINPDKARYPGQETYRGPSDAGGDQGDGAETTTTTTTTTTTG